MLRTCSLKVPLMYNTHDIKISPNRDITSERHFIFEEKPKDCVFNSKFRYIRSDGSLASEYQQEAVISLFTEEESKEKNKEGTKKGYDQEDQLFCEIKGLLVSDERYAYTIAEDLVNKICKQLSLLISRHNSDQQNIQPRVEPNWHKAVWNIDMYQPVERIETEQGSRLLIADRIGLRDTLQIRVKSRLPAEEVDISDWLRSRDDDYNFLLNEFYTALGEEKPKSKFFHLFSMIEFCEREYANYNGAERLLTDEEIRELGQKLKDELKDKHSGEALNNIVSRVQKTLTDSTNIGRIDKLQNILIAMGITQYKDGIKMTAIDKKLLKHITTLRNKSFHGTAVKGASQTGQTTSTIGTAGTAGTNDADSDREYSNAVVTLLSICEQILAFVESGKNGGAEGVGEQDA